MREIGQESQLLINEFIKNCSQNNRSVHTLKNYRSDIEKFVSWIEATENRKLHQINSEHISKYNHFLKNGGFIERKLPHNLLVQILGFIKIFGPKKISRQIPIAFQNPMSVASRKRHLSSIKNFYQFLKETHEDKGKKFISNPVKSKLHHIKLKDVDVEHTKLLTPTEFQKIEDKTYRTQERLIIYLLYYAGLRLNELSQLKISQINFEKNTITIARKGGDLHELMPYQYSKIFQQINYYLVHIHERKSDFLFANKEGKALSNKAMYKKIMKITTRAGVGPQITPHSFRKGCATMLYSKTKDIIYVRDYLNHSDAKITQTYIDGHFLREQKHAF